MKRRENDSQKKQRKNIDDGNKSSKWKLHESVNSLNYLHKHIRTTNNKVIALENHMSSVKMVHEINDHTTCLNPALISPDTSFHLQTDKPDQLLT